MTESSGHAKPCIIYDGCCCSYKVWAMLGGIWVKNWSFCYLMPLFHGILDVIDLWYFMSLRPFSCVENVAIESEGDLIKHHGADFIKRGSSISPVIPTTSLCWIFRLHKELHSSTMVGQADIHGVQKKSWAERTSWVDNIIGPSTMARICLWGWKRLICSQGYQIRHSFAYSA